MTEQNRLDALLLRYEELRAQDTPVSPEELCQDCPELVAELKQQIRVLQSMDDLLGGAESEEASAAMTPPDPNPTGFSVSLPAEALCTGSRYQVLRFHAQGGLGEVHVARDEELHREVALKRLQTLHARNPRSRSRFLREAAITSRLEHPSIVPVHSMGQDADGRPFYAMRFIQGQTLQEAIQQFHALNKRTVPLRSEGPSPCSELALRQLLSRFIAVCNTIAYAHSKGIVHRDIKPGNIMLGPYGETLVVDWGLAKEVGAPQGESGPAPQTAVAVEASAPTPALSPTQMGIVIGTPAYMSPEQAEGRWDVVGPASDVYNLGATLYALLTGQPPFEGAHVGEVVDKVKHGDFPRPRDRRKDIPRALEAICLKAMARKPEARYASALEVAADLEHWLADESVSAWREPWTARVRRWLGRHRTLVTATAATVLVATVSLAAATLLLTASNRRERQATNHALQNFQLACQAVDQFCTRVGEDARLREYGLEDFRKEQLETAVKFYEDLVERPSHVQNPGADLGLAQSHYSLGMLEHLLGRLAPAEEHLSHAFQLRQELARGHIDDPSYQKELAQSHHGLGLLYKTTGRDDLAQQAFEQAREILQRLAADHAEVREYQVQLAASHSELANRHKAMGDLGLAEQGFEDVRAIFQRLTDAHPQVAEYQQKLAASEYSLGRLFYDTGRKERAERAYQRALALRQRLADAYPGVSEYRGQLAQNHTILGILYNSTGRPELAKQAHQQAQVIWQRLADAHPQVPGYQRDLAASYNNLAILDKEAGRSGAAEQAYLQARAILQHLAEAHPQSPELQLYLAASHNNLGTLYRTMGRFDLTEQACRQARAIFEHLADAHPETVEYTVMLGGSYWNLGHLLRDDLGKLEEALDCYARPILPLEALLRKDPRQPKAREVLLNLVGGRAVALAMLGRHADAEQELHRAEEIDQGQSRGPTRFYGGVDIRAFRSRVLVLAGDHARGTADVDELITAKPLQGGDLYFLALTYALAASAGQQDANVSEAERAALRERYAAHAVELFRKVRAAGYFHDPAAIQKLRNARELAVLRSREDFQKLVQELEESKEASGR